MIEGHVHVYTPSWWRDMKKYDWLCGVLVVDAVTEVFDEQFLRERNDIDDPPDKILRYLRNVYFETLVTGHKP